MALVVKDRVQETTTTVGTGTITLGGAVLGFQSFATIGNGNTTYYTINDPITGDWEVGIGTYTASGTTLSRTTVLSSSNAGSLVPFAAGSKNVFVTYPSERSVYLDSPGSYPVQNTFNALSATTATLTAGTVSTTPSAGTDLANKSYVDTVAAAGIHYHAPVYVESPNTAGNLNAAYNQPGGPGVGVGATLTNAGTKAALTIDGILMTTTKRVLIYNQTNAYENGVYTVTTVGTPDPGGTNWVLTRATDADTYAPSSPNSLGQGDAFFVTNGDTGAGEGYVCTTVGVITFGTTAITFSQFSAAQVYNAGTGLNLSPSTTFNISNTGVTAATYGSASQVPVFAVNAQGQITSVTNTAIAIAAGAVSGLAASATTDTTNAANITSGTLPTGRLSGSYTGITGVGTLTAGTWNGSVIGPVYGGTGFGTYAVGDLLYADTTTSLAKLADVAVGNALISGGVSSAPSWGKIGLATHVSGTLPIANGGTNTSATATNGGVTYGTGTAYAFTAAGTSGQVLQSNGAAAPTWVNLSTLGVSSFSAGTTGFTPSTATSGAVTLAGTLNVANGGTGVTTSTGTGSVVLSTSPSLVTPILGTPQSGNFSTGTFTWPTFNQNTTGNAATATSAVTLYGSTNLYISPTNANTFNSGFGSAADGSDIWINYRGYNDAFSYFRDFRVGNGKGTQIALFTGSSGNLTLAGTGSSASDWRAPIFYDSNDTGYYVNPNGTSNINQLNMNGPIVRTVSGQGYLNGNYPSSETVTTSGAIYSIGGVYVPGTTTLSNMYGVGYAYTGAGRAVGNSAGTPSDIWGLYGAAAGVANWFLDATNGRGYFNSQVNATIFYDANNTGYYVDPNSRSNIYTLTTADSNELLFVGTSVSTSNTLGIGFNTTDTNYAIYKPAGAWVQPLFVKFYTGIRHYTNNGYDYGTSFWMTDGTLQMSIGQGDNNVRVFGDIRSPIYYDYNDTGYYLDPNSTSNSALRIRGGTLHGPNTTWSQYLYVGTNGNIDVNTATVAVTNGNLHLDARNGYVLYLNNYATSSYTVLNQSARSPIFYDLDNTGYYCDPNGTSNLNVVNVTSGASTGTWYVTGNGSVNGSAGIGLNVYSSGGNGAIMAFHRGGAYAVNMGLDSDNVLRIGGWSAAANLWQLDMSGNNYLSGSSRAPIFYDSNNTGYYVDPASVSNLNGLDIGGSSFTVGGGTISITSGSPLYFMARAWVNFNGTGTVAIRASVNVSSITDNGTGDYTVNFSTGMPDANYVVTGTQNGITQNMNPTVTSLLTGSVRFYTSGGAGAGGGVAFFNYDPTQVSIAIFR